MRFFLSFFILLIGFKAQSQQEMYDICPIKNSEDIPSATIYDQSGQSMDLKEVVSNKAVVLVFYRGGWCPYCTRHLSALQEAKEEIKANGFELIALTPDNFKHLDSSVVRAGNPDYRLFSDKDANAISAFGIGWKVNDELYTKYRTKYNMDTEWWSGSTHHILPVPSVFIVKEGKIVYQHVDPNYSQRLSPELLVSLLASLKE